MINTPEVHEAGKQVYISQVVTNAGDLHMRIFGPVTITQSNQNLVHEKGKEPVVATSYKIDALAATYMPHFVHESFDEAVMAVKKAHVESLELQRKAAEAKAQQEAALAEVPKT